MRIVTQSIVSNKLATSSTAVFCSVLMGLLGLISPNNLLNFERICLYRQLLCYLYQDTELTLPLLPRSIFLSLFSVFFYISLKLSSIPSWCDSSVWRKNLGSSLGLVGGWWGIPLLEAFQNRFKLKNHSLGKMEAFEPNSEQDGRPHILFQIFVMRHEKFLWQRLSSSVQTLSWNMWELNSFETFS